nr:uncharacterized protein LOC128671545 isoform X1 [Plodia interpunctella]
MKFYHKTFKKMLFFILLSVLVTESLGIECSKDRSGRPDPNAIPFSIGNFKLQAGYINWQITYIPICPNSVLEIKVCDDVKPQLMVLSPWRVSVVRRGSRGSRTMVKGKWWCLPGTVDESKLMQPAIATALVI